MRKTLLPRLDAAGLRVCVDYRDFRLGAPLVLGVARAVEQSRYSLALLSPRYLTSTSLSWRTSWPSTWDWKAGSAGC